MLTKRAKSIGIIAIVTTVTSITIVAGGLFWVLQQGSALVDRAQVIADHESRKSTYQSLQDLLARTETERAALLDYTLTETDTIDFLATIESMARTHGVLLVTDTLNVADEKDSTTYQTLHASFTITGEVDAVNTVLKVLEELPYMSRVDGVNIQYGVSDPDFTEQFGVQENVARASVQLVISLLKS